MSLPQARVVGAFQNLSASHLLDLEHDSTATSSSAATTVDAAARGHRRSRI